MRLRDLATPSTTALLGLSLTFSAALLNCGDDDDDAGGAAGLAGAGGGQAGRAPAGAAGQAGAGQAGAGQAGAGAGQGGGTSQAGASGAGGAAACDALQARVEDSLAKAQACNPAIDSIQCQDVVKTPCCDAVIANRDSEAGQAYLSAFEAFQAASCTAACPKIICRTFTSGQCTVGPQGGTDGVCQPNVTTAAAR
jgi:hypothetical protein